MQDWLFKKGFVENIEIYRYTLALKKVTILKQDSGDVTDIFIR